VSTIEYMTRGIAVSTFTGPATDPPTKRKRVRISILSGDGSESQSMTLTLQQWSDLIDAIINLSDIDGHNG
jgi:hypothetical protein